MPRKPGPTSKAAQEAFANVQRNIKARLKALGVSAYAVSQAVGRHDTWISDGFRRSEWVSIVWLVDVGEAIGVPGRHLMLPRAKFRASSYPAPYWLERLWAEKAETA